MRNHTKFPLKIANFPHTLIHTKNRVIFYYTMKVFCVKSHETHSTLTCNLESRTTSLYGIVLATYSQLQSSLSLIRTLNDTNLHPVFVWAVENFIPSKRFLINISFESGPFKGNFLNLRSFIPCTSAMLNEKIDAVLQTYRGRLITE